MDTTALRVSPATLFLLLIAVDSGNASTIWTGPPITFTEAAGANPTLPANQDRLVPDVWITRASTEGIYNAEDETGYSKFSGNVSPLDTEWADGRTESGDPTLLTYTNWFTWARNIHGGPPHTVNVNAVMHIIPDDIYLDVTFKSWGGSAGGFSYVRATPANVPEPATIALLFAGCAGLFFTRTFRKR